MRFCPNCGTRRGREDVRFRNLGRDPHLLCPACAVPLEIFELEFLPKLRIERCSGCHGFFINSGELELLMDARDSPLPLLFPPENSSPPVRLDSEIFYHKCPYCVERMTRVNFGERSGVVLQRCGRHGLWLKPDEIRRIRRWWETGGREIYFQNRNSSVGPRPPMRSNPAPRGNPAPPPLVDAGSGSGTWDGVGDLIGIVFEVLSIFSD